MRQLATEYADFSEAEVWSDIEELVGKTLAAITPHILATAGEVPGESNFLSRCFQLLGFDVLLDSAFKPHLLEINHHPSLQTDAPIDFYVKSLVTKPLVRMISLDARANRRAQKAHQNFAAPSTEEREEWEEQFTNSDNGFAPSDPAACSDLTSRYVAPLMPLLRIFVHACGTRGSRAYDEMSSVRFARLMRKLGVSGAGCIFSTPEMDLLFIQYLKTRGGGTNSLEFYDFVDALLGPVGDRLAPGTPARSFQRLIAVSRVLLAAE
jgi:hypothetical protein